MKSYRIEVKSIETNAIVTSFVVSGSLTVGREGTDITLGDGRVSRRHAELSVTKNGSLEVTDLGSTNGILVNGVRVLRAQLKEGHAFQIASLILEVKENAFEIQRDWPGMWQCLPPEKRGRFNEYY